MENKYKYLPGEMKVLKRFVGWKRENLGEKVAKLPFSLLDGKAKDWNREDRWVDFKNIENINNPIGFILVEEDNIVCIDLDNAIVNGQLSSMAEEIIKEFSGTYMEISQSGKGLHIFARGNLENNLNLSSNGIEIYKNNRHIVLTGNV